MQLDKEYETLRTELLQLYSEQSRLAFFSTISGLAVLFGLFKVGIPMGAGVVIWVMILIAITWKLTSNYHRIYRIGSYLRVIHEQKGDRDYSPKIDEPAWHYRTRKIGAEGIASWKIFSGSKADGRFIRLLGVAAVLSVISYIIFVSHNAIDIYLTILSFALFMYLYFITGKLFKMKREADEFEEAYLRFVERNISN